MIEDPKLQRTYNASVSVFAILSRTPDLSMGEAILALSLVLNFLFTKGYNGFDRLKAVDAFCERLHKDTAVKL